MSFNRHLNDSIRTQLLHLVLRPKHRMGEDAMPNHDKASGASAALNGHHQGTMQPDATGRPSRTRIKHYIGLYDGAGITVSRALVLITLSAVLWALIYLMMR